MPRKRNPQTGAWMYLVRNSEHSMTEPSHLWRDRNGDEMDPTDEELDRYLPDEPTIA